MKQCVCDTDILFEYFENNNDAIELLNSYAIISPLRLYPSCVLRTLSSKKLQI